MLQALRIWQERGIIKKKDSRLLHEGKRIFIEGEKTTENRLIVEEYKKAAERYGVSLCCVFRGINAEGSNFPDQQAREIILVGVPYADISDPIVKTQINYLNSKQQNLGERWYILDAFKVANQSIGRGIRHRDDWCHFTHMDQRYKTHFKMLSRWSVSGDVKII